MKTHLIQLFGTIFSAFQGAVGQYSDDDPFLPQKINELHGARINPALKFKNAVNVKYYAFVVLSHMFELLLWLWPSSIFFHMGYFFIKKSNAWES
jgi:hypothetical protein